MLFLTKILWPFFVRFLILPRGLFPINMPVFIHILSSQWAVPAFHMLTLLFLQVVHEGEKDFIGGSGHGVEHRGCQGWPGVLAAQVFFSSSLLCQSPISTSSFSIMDATNCSISS